SPQGDLRGPGGIPSPKDQLERPDRRRKLGIRTDTTEEQASERSRLSCVNWAKSRSRYGGDTIGGAQPWDRMGDCMGDRTATVLIEARALMGEALVSLMESHSYNVICSVGSTADIDRSIVKEVQPELVLLGAMPTERIADATSYIRRRRPDAKIIMLLENA